MNSIITYVQTPQQNLFDDILKTGLVKHISSGLTIDGFKFNLNNKHFTILSGSIHYFRVHPQYWFDRLLRLKSAGLNTVSTYVPWNLHQTCPNCSLNFDGILNIRRFLMTAQQLGLFVILRPGPYICAEWDFGGLPSWLLTDPDMKVRSNHSSLYIESVKFYLASLLEQIHDLQFQMDKGGSIIAWQIENELASYYPENGGQDGTELIQAQAYVKYLVETLRNFGAIEFMFTSDGDKLFKNGRVRDLTHGTGLFEAVNFQLDPINALNVVKLSQPFKPLFVAEYWGGWFDHWGSPHKTFKTDVFTQNLESIIQQGASFNIYMFHGGTNFGFNNGANAESPDKYLPTTTSYDYDATVSENGFLTEKYFKIRELIQNYSSLLGEYSVLKKLPPVPPNIPAAEYGRIYITHHMTLDTIIDNIKTPVSSDRTLYMEEIMRYFYSADSSFSKAKAPSGFGYALYRANPTPVDATSLAKVIIHSRVHDRGDVYWNDQLMGVLSDANFTAVNVMIEDSNKAKSYKLDILVENMGRVNFNYYSNPIPDYLKLDNQRKGISGKVSFQGRDIDKWMTYLIDFNEEWMEGLPRNKFNKVNQQTVTVPSLFKAILVIDNLPKDTFVEFEGWQKGCIFVNNFNIGRYWNIGPQRTLYIPSALLRVGENEILVWELERIGQSLNFVNNPVRDMI
ncbi:unnamed protein product [Gordionus sp. m RMFG-2023]|uniref:beta-galactosidase-1-like protein 2 n=1 Tax=Gordionus sp. m RMFG-2023 TaxID=3053472 RepID=UPI0030E09660